MEKCITVSMGFTAKLNVSYRNVKRMSPLTALSLRSCADVHRQRHCSKYSHPFLFFRIRPKTQRVKILELLGVLYVDFCQVNVLSIFCVINFTHV